MQPIVVNLINQCQFERRHEPVRFGVPFAKGELKSADSIALFRRRTQELLPVQCDCLATWPDGSIQWLLIQTQSDWSTIEQETLELNISPGNQSQTSAFAVNEEQAHYSVQVSQHIHRISKSDLSIHTSLQNNADTWLTHFQLAGEQNELYQLRLDSLKPASGANPISLSFNATGHWILPDGKSLARFTAEIRFYAQGGLVNISCCIHNPNRAMHPGGLWDLGDPGSIHFSELKLTLDNTAIKTMTLLPEFERAPIEINQQQSFRLYQDSSGGEHWNSANHIDRHQALTTSFKGYRIDIDGKCVDEGSRAQPQLHVHSETGSCTIALQHFWQNFPSALENDGTTINVGLFPKQQQRTYELQGGERKTQSVWLCFSDNDSALTWVQAPLIAHIAPEHVAAAKVLPWFSGNFEPNLLDELIGQGIYGPANFFSKREVIDEYGWRNFGDIFADHETLYQQKDEPPLISHYNNQYDAVYGFARQFMLTGNPQWHQLMDELAWHITDIDIYHTVEDRAEYNNGLFWHTDHYLAAHTATHRTFSKFNDTSSTPGQTGGGPGAEHCYTTGLLLHYHLTGANASKQAVIDLANWMIVAHEGSAGLLSRLWSIKCTELPKLLRFLKGKKPVPYFYPFTRGTGNYVVALLDAYEASGSSVYLNTADRVIRETAHPEDDISARDLLNVEVCWSYLVFLNSLARYINLKHKLGIYDDGFHYAKATFLAYSHWILNNERLFLNNPGQLEYPNDTWAAQDIRKAMLLFQAAELDPAHSQALRTKALEWLHYVTEHLSNSKERHFARILIILLQNHGPHNNCEGYPPQSADIAPESFGQPPTFSIPLLLSRILRKLGKGLLEFRLARERAWLLARLGRS